jgi:hypothetical protein
MTATACDFTVALRIIAANGLTVRGDLNDQANGLTLLAPVALPQDNTRQSVYTSPRSHGDFASGPPLDEPGDLIATVDVEGATWAQVETRWQQVRTWLRAEWTFFVEYEADGVVTRWRTRRPNVEPQEHRPDDLMQRRLTYVLRFHCQPNPQVTFLA